MNPKLTEDGWKAVALKFKVKDRDLQRALSVYEFIDEDEYEDRLKEIANIGRLAAALKKNKEVAPLPVVVKYLADVVSATESEQRDINKAKALAEKAQALAAKTEAMTQKKAEAEAKKRDQEGEDDDKEDEGEEEEEQEQDYAARLLAAFRKLKGAKDASYEFIVCDAKPHCSVMVAKKITPKHKEELTKITGGSKRFLPVGTCRMEDGRFTFTTDQPVAGLARKLQASIQHFTGKKLAMKVGAESVDEDEEPLLDAKNPDAGPSPERKGGAPIAAEGPQQTADTSGAEQPASAPTTETSAGVAASQPSDIPKTAPPAGGALSLSASVGRGGKNKPEDVKTVQTALNSRIKAGLTLDGKCGPKTITAIMTFQKALGQFKPDGLVEPRRGTARALASTAKLGPPPPPPKPIPPPKLGKATLAQAPVVWHSTRNILNTNIEELKKGVRAQYGSEDPELLKQIDENMVKLSGVLGKLDTRLADSLAKANAARSDAERAAELKNAKAILTEYIKYVKSEPLIAHMDSNPFGVETNLRKVLTDSLTHMAQAIG